MKRTAKKVAEMAKQMMELAMAFKEVDEAKELLVELYKAEVSALGEAVEAPLPFFLKLDKPIEMTPLIKWLLYAERNEISPEPASAALRKGWPARGVVKRMEVRWSSISVAASWVYEAMLGVEVEEEREYEVSFGKRRRLGTELGHLAMMALLLDDEDLERARKMAEDGGRGAVEAIERLRAVLSVVREALK